MIDFTKARRMMVDCQVRPADVTNRELLAALLAIPRERFVPAGLASVAYLDRDLPVDAKRALFTSLDVIARPEVVLASNTSSISITSLGAATKRPDRVLGMHFMNPVPLMTLVEIIRGQTTSDESMRVGSELCVRLGKTPVEAADFPGFIAWTSSIEIGWPIASLTIRRTPLVPCSCLL